MAEQNNFCPVDATLTPNLADSPWPIFHRNNYAQAYTCLAGPWPGESLAVLAKTNIRGGTSPWTYLSDTYPNGERVLLQSNSTHVFKFIDTGNEIKTVDSLRIDFDPISSFGWNFLLGRNKIWYTYDPKDDTTNNRTSRIFKLSDADTTNPFSEIVVLDTFDFGVVGINRVQHFSIAYDGNIFFKSDTEPMSNMGIFGVLSPDFQLLDTLWVRTEPGEIIHHNAFPIDELNASYHVTTKRLLQILWDGQQLSKGFEAFYDFVHDGPTGTFAEGSGTTPTLLGWGNQDKLVVVADGHDKNNLVAFWRELPVGWTGVPGMDIHFADSIRLPAARRFSNLFQSIENSPTAYGYDMAVAQFNGFLGQPCPTTNGVQKVHWDTISNEFSIEWVQRAVNFNGVLTYSAGSNMVYGSGKEDNCSYYYYGLDWDTGDTLLRVYLGEEGTFNDNPFDDGGNNHLIDENGNIYFAGGASLVKVGIAQRATNLENEMDHFAGFHIFPNPAHDQLYVQWDGESQQLKKIRIIDLKGQTQLVCSPSSQIDISTLMTGLYLIEIATEEGMYREKIMVK